MDGDLEQVKSLLQKGTEPNLRDSANYTALHYASRSRHESVSSFCGVGHVPTLRHRVGPLLFTDRPTVGQIPSYVIMMDPLHYIRAMKRYVDCFSSAVPLSGAMQTSPRYLTS
ncbi:unnamed protein product [Oncorhynchus mykiss]|uniref:Uncharacterized protein n=1 Tax=Oncorhynchus mykiss TaxID=8022 RepID=A0A060VPK9_ONCMY|nr:unnamed protein product [Oncorhynchus mykiss]